MQAVVFDLDGVLVDSEQLWDAAYPPEEETAALAAAVIPSLEELTPQLVRAAPR